VRPFVAKLPIGKINFPELLAGFEVSHERFILGNTSGKGGIIPTIFGLIQGISLTQFVDFRRNLLDSVALEGQINSVLQLPKGVKISAYSSLMKTLTIVLPCDRLRAIAYRVILYTVRRTFSTHQRNGQAEGKPSSPCSSALGRVPRSRRRRYREVTRRQKCVLFFLLTSWTLPYVVRGA
jgi:hypothetical protein